MKGEKRETVPSLRTDVPGYKALPSQYSDDAADHVRYAEVLQRAGDPTEAARLLESTLDACARATPELPGWLCGRLAALYRSLGRHDDEVLLLERYRESQASEDAGSRFDARLSKARAIAERKRRTDTRALSSVRCVINGCEDEDMASVIIPPSDDGAFSPETTVALRLAFSTAAADGDLVMMSAPLVALCNEARARGYAAERIVVSLKLIWQGMARPAHVTGELWDALYRDALTRTLAIYFKDLVP
jgi:hypothetical protein